MNLQHVNVKIFVDGDLSVDLNRFIEVFHRWIAEGKLDELLIDVADYRHVPMGPGVVLVGHEADYGMDMTGNRPGLRFNCKVALNGSNTDRFRHALQSAAGACQLLEAEFDGLRFCRNGFELSINDRALAPNTAETFATCKPDLEEFFQSVFGSDDVKIDYASDEPRSLFGVSVSHSSPLDFAGLTGS